MGKFITSLVKYEKPYESVKKAIELAKGLEHLPEDARVFIKPNIVYWIKDTPFPKWGMITTSRVVEDVVKILNEKDVKEIIIGEGTLTEKPNDKETPADAFEKLGYNKLAERYNVKVYNVFERPFKKIKLTDDLEASMNADMLESDFLVDIPVLKTHAQCMVSLGIKNLKGLINIPSRKKFHSADEHKDLDYNVAQLANKIPPSLTIIDGIYTLERGPAMDGRAYRKNILVASSDILSADLVGAKLLGIEPSTVPHLAQAAKDRNRPADLSDVEIVGEKIDDLASPHEWDYIYADNDTIPLPYKKAGITGIKYHKYDKTMCTYCSGLNGVLLMAIKSAWKGKPFNNIEILTGKVMEPTPGMNVTILVGQCQYLKNKDNPNIKKLVAIKGCPPKIEDLREKLKEAGIRVPAYFFKNIDKGPLLFLERYKGKSEFDESFYKIK
ncbi:MAG: DUF362 domain-containing protein [Promethearchaeota archaeon]